MSGNGVPAIVRLQAPEAVEAQRAPKYRRYVVDHRASGSILSVTYSLDSSVVIAGFASGEIVQWSTITEKCKMFKRHYGAVQTLDISPNPDDSRVISGGADGMLYRWALRNEGKAESIAGHLRTVWMVRHSPDGKYFASCSADCTVRLWDDLTAQSVAVFNQHKASVTCVQFSRNGLLASGGWDNDVVIFNVASRQAVHHLRGHTARVTHIAFTPSGDLLASASSDCAVRVWSPSTGECYDKFEVHEGDVSQVGLSAGTLVSCSADGTIWRMDIKNERPPDHPVRIHTAPIAALAFSPDESVTATVSHDGSAALWDTATLNNICRFIEPGHSPITCCVFDPDGTKLVTGGKAGKLIVWDLMPQIAATKQKRTSCVIS